MTASGAHPWVRMRANAVVAGELSDCCLPAQIMTCSKTCCEGLISRPYASSGVSCYDDGVFLRRVYSWYAHADSATRLSESTAGRRELLRGQERRLHSDASEQTPVDGGLRRCRSGGVRKRNESLSRRVHDVSVSALLASRIIPVHKCSRAAAHDPAKLCRGAMGRRSQHQGCNQSASQGT